LTASCEALVKLTRWQGLAIIQAAALLLVACRAASPAPPSGTLAPSPQTPAPSPTRMGPPTGVALPPMPTPLPLPPARFGALLPEHDLVPVRLTIPRIDLDAPIVEVGLRQEGDLVVWETASHAVGYHQGTGTHGSAGNVVLSGHISSRYHGNVFKRLPEVRPGDVAVVQTRAQQAFVYRVTAAQVVLPSAVEFMDATPDETLTLITCVPDGVYSHRLIVQAKPV
jgi:LPXTG-site transpeptidase (sortase) family protein